MTVTVIEPGGYMAGECPDCGDDGPHLVTEDFEDGVELYCETSGTYFEVNT